MVNKLDFNRYIEKLVLKDKKKVITLSKKYLIVSILVTILGLFLLLKTIYRFFRFYYIFSRIDVIVGVLLVVMGILMFVVRNKNKQRFRDNYREKAINYLLSDYNHCFKEEGWPMSWDFDNSQFVKSYDLCSTSDCLIVNIPNDDGSNSSVDLKICDLYAYNLHRDEEGNISHSKVYKGMFGAIEFPYKFKCFLSIDVNYKKRGLKLDKVELEDINFGKKFKVYSNNQIEARYILTPKMMEKLLFLEEKFNQLKIVVVDNYLYIGAPYVNLFELDDLKKDDISSMFENIYDEISTVLKIVEEIKNNNKVFKTEAKKRMFNKKKEDN